MLDHNQYYYINPWNLSGEEIFSRVLSSHGSNRLDLFLAMTFFVSMITSSISNCKEQDSDHRKMLKKN